MNNNELELAVLPIQGQEPGDSLIRIEKWFREVYPRRTKDTCLLKNAGAFRRLIDCCIAALEEQRRMDPAPMPLFIPRKG